MLDSGAFSVWSRGATIDLRAYIEFCLKYPDTTAFVALDVIPGKPNEKRRSTKQNVETSCKQGWHNYKQMLKAGIPQKKIIPVFHQNDHIHWLKRYIKEGADYIGISPANDRTTSEKLKWMKKDCADLVNKYNIKTHGFAVTSFRLMTDSGFRWWSVDSASWVRLAAYGKVYIPRKTEGKWDYSISPRAVAFSVKNPDSRKTSIGTYPLFYHNKASDYTDPVDTLHRLGLIWRPPSQAVIAIRGPHKEIDEYLEQENLHPGQTKIVAASPDEKLKKGDVWANKERTKKMIVIERGISSDVEVRRMMNAKFLQRANKALRKKKAVNFIYFAGSSHKKLEHKLGCRLLSFVDLWTPSGVANFTHHIKLIKEER